MMPLNRGTQLSGKKNTLPRRPPSDALASLARAVGRLFLRHAKDERSGLAHVDTLHAALGDLLDALLAAGARARAPKFGGLYKIGAWLEAQLEKIFSIGKLKERMEAHLEGRLEMLK